MLTSKQIREFLRHPVWEELCVMYRSKKLLVQIDNNTKGLDAGSTEFNRGRIQELSDIMQLPNELLAEIEQIEFQKEQEDLSHA